MTTLPSIRRATPNDAEGCHEVMWMAVTDLGRRRGTPLLGSASEWWASSESLQRFLADRAAEWWVAEEDSRIVGYGRSIEREGLLELTEFFVLPAAQSRGLGRALLTNAFPSRRGHIRSIIATTDERALKRYYAAGTAPRFPILTLKGAPRSVEDSCGLTPSPLTTDNARGLRAVREIELATLESARGEAEIRWLLGDRAGFLYTRGDKPVGFAFIGRHGTGPVAALEPADLPDVLLDVEDRAAALGLQEIEFQLPGPNEVAARHLLSRGFRIDPWVNLLMSDRPFGKFDRILGFGPPLFL
ncbi:MAG: GNAT family N-acetyltransferase [Candidatus Acidiferrales bacterium]